MQSEITKLCADSLRSFAQNNYGIQLKSSHAHELVAAYFGYSSRAALLADTNCPMTNLRQAQFVVLTPTAPIKERCKGLKGLPENLPHELVEGVYLPLYDENDKWILTKIWPNLEELGKALADQYLQSKPAYFRDMRVQRQGVKVEFENNEVAIIVTREYVNPGLTLETGRNVLRGVVDVFNLTRVAGYIGYAKRDHYSAEAETLEAAVGKMAEAYHGIISNMQSAYEAQQTPKVEITFTDWLKKQKNRDSPLGDLANDMLNDTTWPENDSLDGYRSHLRSFNASREAIETLEKAWKTYHAFIKRKHSKKAV